MSKKFASSTLMMAFAFVATISTSIFAQTAETTEKVDDGPKAYEFKIVKSCETTDVKSQDATGTCWSFATASFIESEALRMGKGKHNLSEMFVVKNIYKDKANNYVLRQGKAQFSQGALAHDFLNAAGRYGIVPDDVFDGLDEGETKHDHGEMEAVMTGMLEKIAARKKLSPKWQNAVANVLDAYLGKAPERFEYRDRSYSPQEFAKELGFERDNYVSLSSYTHHPFNKDFVLEIPDNFSNGLFHNVPIDDIVATIDHAIENGYTVAWDGDVSEKGFSAGRGIAVLPKNPLRRDVFTHIGEEQEVTQEMRQKTFLSFSTTDDHLMHLVGTSRDAEGNKYYVIKNSWGKVGPHSGYLHMSEAYVRLKTVAIIVHKDAVQSK
ncbi:MAG: C1 family peptidase [Planctomycetota bacterium]